MVFVDANIVLELILPGRKKAKAVARILGQQSDMALSMLSAHLIWHFGRLQGLPDDFLTKIIDDYKLLSVTEADYNWAKHNERGKDFEDALQVAIALKAGCDTFITLDGPLIKRYIAQPINFLKP